MTQTSQVPGPGGEHSPEGFLAALRSSTPARIATELGDLAHLLQEFAADPGAVFEREDRARRDLSELLGNLQACRGALDALEARTVIDLRDLTRRERFDSARDRAAHEGDAEPSETAVHQQADGATENDITLITRRSPHMAGRTLASAQRLVEQMPRVMNAFADGRISTDAAYAIAEATSVLDPELVGEVDRVLEERLPRCDGHGTRRWKDEVAAIAQELDPTGATLRHRRARKQRHVTLRPGQNGMATLSARLPAIDARLIHKRLSLEAERRRAAGEREGHGALMADALTDALLSRGEAEEPPVTLDVGVIITDRALFRPDAGDPAHLEGYGSVPAEAVREQLRAALEEPEGPAEDPLGADGPALRLLFRRLYTHPTSGELIAMDSTARLFPAAMKRFLTWRDTSCRGPHCNAAARQGDHIVPVSRGGPTTVENGQSVCGHCNKKEQYSASVDLVEDPEMSGHTVRWTGESGTERITSPTPLTWPRGSARTDASSGGERGSVRRPRSRREPAPPPPRPRSPRPPARSGPAASGAAGADPARRARPSGRRKDRAAPADDQDH